MSGDGPCSDFVHRVRCSHDGPDVAGTRISMIFTAGYLDYILSCFTCKRIGDDCNRGKTGKEGYRNCVTGYRDAVDRYRLPVPSPYPFDGHILHRVCENLPGDVWVVVPLTIVGKVVFETETVQ